MNTPDQLKVLHEKAMINLEAIGLQALGLTDNGKIKTLDALQVQITEAFWEGPKDPTTSAIEHLQYIQTLIANSQVLIADLLLRGDLATFLEYHLATLSNVTEWVDIACKAFAAEKNAPSTSHSH